MLYFFCTFCWLMLFLYLIYQQFLKFFCLGFMNNVMKVFYLNFEHSGLQSSLFFKLAVNFLLIFWMGGMMFPLFCPWSCIGFLLFLTNFSWLGVRIFTLVFFSFMIFFEEEHHWNWLSSLVMFLAHLLSYVMSGVALTLRISIIFLIGHFLMFMLLDMSLLSSFFIMLIVFPVELFFAFLQSYIFLTLVCMFMLNMI